MVYNKFQKFLIYTNGTLRKIYKNNLESSLDNDKIKLEEEKLKARDSKTKFMLSQEKGEDKKPELEDEQF